ncbi:tyrosine-protein phosphatase [Aliamphritea spongicola]|uniref:tyrosine-protein phosphatase n=1 Tax=Aliamphritea spongicola TaxID=707589 RepID=UPI00196AECFD|nr:CpsB/CapC family capsule biosynthesis tyrosine phosphatase [Aliamphritea spongicola]MBN3560939.1 capsular biosynthesis protein [Aliamphritea spongicola]
MIDLHCHLLPGIDDGPASLEEAVELAAMAAADGITHAVATPHIHPGRYDNNIHSITPAYEALKNAIVERNIPLELGMAAEVRISVEMLAMIPTNQIPFLGEWEGRKVLLLELPHSHIPPGCDKLVDWLLARDILPMIAHPERNKDIMHKLEKIEPFVSRGCLFQLTSMSVAGKFGDVAHERALEILQNGWATIIATDAHNTNRRPPVLSEGMHAATEVVGEATARQLVYDNPARLIGLH